MREVASDVVSPKTGDSDCVGLSVDGEGGKILISGLDWRILQIFDWFDNFTVRSVWEFNSSNSAIKSPMSSSSNSKLAFELLLMTRERAMFILLARVNAKPLWDLGPQLIVKLLSIGDRVNLRLGDSFGELPPPDRLEP
jgi:hypothetical protein